MVLPFKANNYIADELINWSEFSSDPMFILSFPQKAMLAPRDYGAIKALYDSGADQQAIKQAADDIRLSWNPHPAGQMEYNIPVVDDYKLGGVQHKYRETVLFFPEQGQTCHAFCTFCFRWPQFTGIDELKIASHNPALLARYVSTHPEVTDVLFTGGDPLVMKTCLLASYIEPLLGAECSNIRAIRIGSKALSHWPYRFVTDDDSGELLDLFSRVRHAGKHLAFMAHFNHPVELETNIAQEAIQRIQEAGVVIRTQAPVLKHINDSPEIWIGMWRRQVALNCIPYYMFVARDTGAQRYFSVPLVKVMDIYKQASQSLSGICRTARGPIMSCFPGKVQIQGVCEIHGEKVFVLRMIQGRNPDWAAQPFFAGYDEKSVWFDSLKPAFGEESFFFQEELDAILEPGESEMFLE